MLYRGDPGDNQHVDTLARSIGRATNNEAEYRAVIEGLRMARHHEPRRLVLRSDSSLVINQLSGKFRVRAPKLRELHREAKVLIESFPEQPRVGGHTESLQSRCGPASQSGAGPVPAATRLHCGRGSLGRSQDRPDSLVAPICRRSLKGPTFLNRTGFHWERPLKEWAGHCGAIPTGTATPHL